MKEITNTIKISNQAKRNSNTKQAHNYTTILISKQASQATNCSNTHNFKQ